MANLPPVSTTTAAKICRWCQWAGGWPTWMCRRLTCAYAVGDLRYGTYHVMSRILTYINEQETDHCDWAGDWPLRKETDHCEWAGDWPLRMSRRLTYANEQETGLRKWAGYWPTWMSKPTWISRIMSTGTWTTRRLTYANEQETDLCKWSGN